MEKKRQDDQRKHTARRSSCFSLHTDVQPHSCACAKGMFMLFLKKCVEVMRRADTETKRSVRAMRKKNN